MPIFLKDVRVVNGRTGIRIEGGANIVAENVTFDNVDQPWDIFGAQSADIRGTKIRNDPKKGARERNATTGSRKQNGPPLPAFCPSCKTTFPSRNYNWGGASFNAWNNEETCPECGNEKAFLSEGAFDLSGEVVRILTAPDITHAMLAAIGRIADEALSQESIDPEPVIAKFDEVSPKLAAFFRAALIQGRTFFNVAVAMAAFGSFALSVVQTKYAQEQTALAREQTALAREQTNIARKQLQDTTQTQILEALKDIRSNQTCVSKQPSEGRSSAGGAQKKLKARHMRRKDDVARRRALCPKPL